MTQGVPLAAGLQRHPMCGYFLLAFGVSWGGILLILAATGFDLAPMGPWETGGVAALMLLGPSLRDRLSRDADAVSHPDDVGLC